MNRLPSIRAVAPGCLLLALGVAGAAAPPAAAQDDPLPPAHVSYLDGRVLVDHDTSTEDAEASMPVVPGDRLRTEDGRAELLFGDGSLVQLDQSTSVDLLSESRLRLLAGRVAIVASRAQAGRLQIDTPSGSIEIASAGEYRAWLFDDQGRQTLELSVIRGNADLVTDRDRVTVDAGERSWARTGEAPAYPLRFNAAAFDAFDRWALDRAAMRRGTTSARYVPDTLQPYAAVLDTYGSWGYEPTYGYVWYPRVEVGWRPYYAGRWGFYAGFGWTWVGGGAWGWPTHHYGRWGLSAAGAWFWIPGATWGPAWVSWAVAPGYVSWCPLGYYNRPVVGFWGHPYGHYKPGYGHAPWHGWTVVPREHFGGYRVVSRVAIDGRRFDAPGSRPPFVVQDRAPGPPARRADAIGGSRSATGIAVPRGGAPAAIGGGTRVYSNATGAPGPRAGAAPAPGAGSWSRSLPDRGVPGASARTGSRPPSMETTPENASRGAFGSIIARPRTAYGDRLPGDVGARGGPGSTSPRTPSVEAGPGLLPGARGSVAMPRSGPSSGWSSDAVPVHRGMPIEPRTSPSPGYRSDTVAPGGWRGDRTGTAPRTPGPSASPGMAVPRGGVAPRGDMMRAPDGPRYGAPGSPRSGVQAGPSYRAAPPPPPPAAGPSHGGGSPRQAPAGGNGGGGAVPRNGPPPARHR